MKTRPKMPVKSEQTELVGNKVMAERLRDILRKLFVCPASISVCGRIIQIRGLTLAEMEKVVRHLNMAGYPSQIAKLHKPIMGCATNLQTGVQIEKYVLAELK